VKGAVGGTSWNERRDDLCVKFWIFLSEVQRSTGAKRTPEQARRQQGGMVGWVVPERPDSE
jgi:hypothetical protein